MIVGLLMIGAVALLAVIFASSISQLFRRTSVDDCSIEWLDEFSLDSYRPMERLLNEGDYEFLAAQPGFYPGIARELRAERRRIFRIYLRSLIRDFKKLIRLAELMMVYSEQDRPDLARAIFRLRREFYVSIIATEFRLALSPLPVAPVDARRLVYCMAAMRENIQQLALQRLRLEA
jgi:hypothetical protein